MKKKDMLLILVILAAAGLAWLAWRLVPEQKGAMLKITVDGQEYGTYSLEEDRRIEIGDTNTCRIEHGYVSMVEADCPDRICIHTKRIDARGGAIICMPNRVVLEITDPQKSRDTPDAVAG